MDFENFNFEDEVVQFSEEYKVNYEIKDKNKIDDIIIEEINQFCNITEFDQVTSFNILIQHNFDQSRALESLYSDTSDFEMNEETETTIDLASVINTSNVKSCCICLENFENEELLVTFSCKHIICKNCCIMYVLRENSDIIICPYFDCAISTSIKDLNLLDSENFTQCSNIIKILYFNNNKKIFKCNNCHKIIKLELLLKNNHSFEVKCDCGYSYCSICKDTWHESVHCELLKKFDDLNNIESKYVKTISTRITDDMFKWLEEKTKPCPNCFEVIEKNQGCNHMKCIKCKHQFCWICLTSWIQHHKCDEKSNESENLKMQVKEFIELLKENNPKIEKPKFLKEYEMNDRRFIYHSKEMAKELIEFASLRIYEPIFRIKNVLHSCRNLLRYAYIFSLFVNTNVHSRLFDLHRLSLELYTQKLRDNINLNETNPNYQSVVDLCEKQYKTLNDVIIEGYENNYWSFRDYLTQNDPNFNENDSITKTKS